MSTLTTRKPSHLGAILREDVLPRLVLTVSAFAQSLGISRQALHGILSERSGVSAEMALRLGPYLGNGAYLWLDMQSRYDLWQARLKLSEVLRNIRRIEPLEVA